MDPYKVLQLPNTADVEACRQKAKVLYKRYAEAKNAFDSKKVLEAFEMVKRAQKPQELKQVLGRSRKERELDGLFNRQTKKIIKKRKANDEKARMLAREMRKRGVSASRREGLMKHYRAARRSKPSRSRRSRPTLGCAPPPNAKAGPSDPIEALYKIVQHLPSEKKFPLAIPLLWRWITEVMVDVQDSKEHLFYALQTVMDSGHLVSKEASVRADVLKVFRHVLGQPWFATLEEERLRDVWSLCCVMQNECLTDDGFELNALVARLREALFAFPTEEEREQREERGPGPSPGELPGPSPSPSSDGPGPSPSSDVPGPSPSSDEAPPKQERGKTEPGDWDAPEAGSDAASMSDASDAVSVSGSESSAESQQGVWRGPTEEEAEDLCLLGFVDCLALLQGRVKEQWAKATVEKFFTAVYLERTRIPEPLRTRVVNMQGELRRRSKESGGFFDAANGILEAKHMVVDGREDRMSMGAGADAWAAKQFGLIERI